MLKVGDTVRIVGGMQFRVMSVSSGWEPETYHVTLENESGRVTLQDCWLDEGGGMRDAVGARIDVVKPADGAPDADAADQLGLF